MAKTAKQRQDEGRELGAALDEANDKLRSEGLQLNTGRVSSDTLTASDVRNTTKALQVSANTLVNPPTAPALPVTEPPQIPPRVDSTVNKVLGSIRSDSEKARELETKQQEFGGLVGGAQQFQTEALGRFGVTPERLSELEDIELQLADRKADSLQTKVDITGAAGQTLGQARREVTQEDREEAVRSTRLAMRGAVLRGNIETGRQLAKDAVSIFMSDRKFTQDSLASQIRSLEGVVDEETRQLLEAESRAHAEDKAFDEGVKTDISDAMTSGSASPTEIDSLTDPLPTHPDKTQERLLQNEELKRRQALAQSIVARGATQERQLSIDLKQAQLNKARQTSTKVIDRGDGMKQLINSQTGEVIATYGEGELAGIEPYTELQESINQADIVNVDSLKTHDGMSKAVGQVKLARFTPFKVDVLTGDVSDFIASIDQMTKSLTLTQLATAKERGITFGALNQSELTLVADAATKINNWREGERNSEGEVIKTTHYETSEKKFKAELDVISNLKKLDFVLKGGDPESVGVKQTADGAYWTQNSDGSFTKIR